jgi:diacylglycerol O-acyltransferase / wax synthase
MQHLSALDAVFLQLESPQTPMHVGSLILFEKPAKQRGSFYPALRKHVASRMHLAPLFARKVAFMPFDVANPVWLHDDDVDLDYHVRSLKLPKPGTQAQLEACIAKLHAQLLDRKKPLWEFFVIEGLKSGEIAFYSKIHHATLDGQGGVALAFAILDTGPVPRAVPPPGKRVEGGLKPSAAKMLGAAFRNTVAQYSRIARAVPEAIRVAGAVGAVTLQNRSTAKSSAKAGKSAGTLASLKALIPKGTILGPRTAWNVAVKAPRNFVTARLSLDEAKFIAKSFDTKLNDAVLAVCSGAMRRYFEIHGGVPAKPMIGAVPASLRAPGDMSQSNQVTMMLINLATSTADPVKRMKQIGAASTKAKALTGGMKSVIPNDLPSLGVPWLMSLITSLYNNPAVANRIPVLANVVISNVPGPQMPLYMAGAKMSSYYPVSIVVHGLGLNITVQSYNGWLDFGFIACSKAVPDVRKMAGYLREAHQELLQAAAGLAARAEPKARAIKGKPARARGAQPMVKSQSRSKIGKRANPLPK